MNWPMRRRLVLAALAFATGTQAMSLRAQSMPVVGFLNLVSAAGGVNEVKAFLRGLKEAGYIEGQNVVIEYRWGSGEGARLPGLARDLVTRRVAVIVVGGGPAARQAVRQSAGSTPVVFVTASDPIQEGLVASLNRPGGNFTGVSMLSTGLGAKRLELIHELLPAATRIAVLVNPAGSGTEINCASCEKPAAGSDCSSRWSTPRALPKSKRPSGDCVNCARRRSS
jgi:putative ABC transport system substrate-binding protein